MQLYWHKIWDHCGSEIYCYTTEDTIELLDYIKNKQNEKNLFVVSQDYGVFRMNTVNSWWNKIGKNECEEEDTHKRKLLQDEVEQ